MRLRLHPASQARLVQIFAAKELGLDLDMLSWRLRQLTLVLPDLGAHCSATPKFHTCGNFSWSP